MIRPPTFRKRLFLGAGWHIAPDALRGLETYNWPGNIRQLINVIERAKILADDHFITTDELPAILWFRCPLPHSSTSNMSNEDRQAILEILLDTKRDLPVSWRK